MKTINPARKSNLKFKKFLTSQNKIPAKSLLKLGITMQAGSFIPLDWNFCDEYDDNQLFRDLVNWDLPEYTWVIDRGNITVDYLKQFTEHNMFFIQKTYDGHTFHDISCSKLPLVRPVLGKYRLRYEKIGYISREDGLEVIVRRIIAVNEYTSEEISLTTNDFDSSPHVIIKQHERRWEIEVLNDWLKNAIGPNDDHSLTQWSRIKGLRNLMRIWLLWVFFLHMGKANLGLNGGNHNGSPLEISRCVMQNNYKDG